MLWQFVIAWVFLELEFSYPDYDTRDGPAFLSFTSQKMFSKVPESQNLSRKAFDCSIIKSCYDFV